MYLIYTFLWSSILIITCTLRFQIHCVSKKRKVTKKRRFVAPWPNHFACRTFIPRVVFLNLVRCWSHIWLYRGWIRKRLAMVMTGKSSAFLLHCVKSVLIHSYSGPYFPAFRLNMETYFISLCIQSKFRKMLTLITLNTDTFYAVLVSYVKITKHTNTQGRFKNMY